jgi:hypothetical protein
MTTMSPVPKQKVQRPLLRLDYYRRVRQRITMTNDLSLT